MYNVEQTPPTSHGTSWSAEVHQYLEHGTMPSHFSIQQERELQLKVLSYHLVHGVIYRNNHNGILLRFLEAHDLEKVLCDLHDGPDTL